MFHVPENDCQFLTHFLVSGSRIRLNTGSIPGTIWILRKTHPRADTKPRAASLRAIVARGDLCMGNDILFSKYSDALSPRRCSKIHEPAQTHNKKNRSDFFSDRLKKRKGRCYLRCFSLSLSPRTLHQGIGNIRAEIA